MKKIFDEIEKKCKKSTKLFDDCAYSPILSAHKEYKDILQYEKDINNNLNLLIKTYLDIPKKLRPKFQYKKSDTHLKIKYNGDKINYEYFSNYHKTYRSRN